MTDNKQRKRQNHRPPHRAQQAPKGSGARHEAVRLLTAILTDKRPFDEIWAQSLEGGDLKTMIEPDRALTRLIIMTTLRHLRHIDNVLATFLKNPLPKTAPGAQNILRTAIAQLLFIKSPAHAVLNIATSLAAADRSSRAFKGLINGVLRNYTRTDPEKFMGPKGPPGNTPEWLHNRWKFQFGNDHAKQIARVHQYEPALDITVKSDPENWAEKLNGILMPTGTIRIANAGNPVNLPGFTEGEWWVQDAAAAMPARFLGDIAGKQVLDLCAAPGGKTAQLVNAGAHVTAVERAPHRMKRLAQNLERLNLEANLVTADAGEYRPSTPPDAILLDAPCSATGTIRRHPDVPYLKTHKNIIDLAAIQMRLIDHAADILKPGGILVYCVCSLEHEEGEDQIINFLARNRNFSLKAIELSEIPDLEPALLPKGDVRILPHFYSSHGTNMAGMDGFYIARLIKS